MGNILGKYSRYEPTPQFPSHIRVRLMDDKLKEALDIISWFIENDETNEGDEPMEAHNGQSWNDLNGYWIDGLNRARKFVAENQPLDAK